MVDQGIEHIYVNTPVVVTVTQSNNKLLRMATLKAMLDAKKKQIKIFPVEEEYESETPVCKLEKMTINNPTKHCRFIEEEENNTKANQLIQLLRKQLENEEF